MAGLDREHLPDGVVLHPERRDTGRLLDPRAWIAAVRRPTPRRLETSVAEHLAEARKRGEV